MSLVIVVVNVIIIIIKQFMKIYNRVWIESNIVEVLLGAEFQLLKENCSYNLLVTIPCVKLALPDEFYRFVNQYFMNE